MAACANTDYDFANDGLGWDSRGADARIAPPESNADQGPRLNCNQLRAVIRDFKRDHPDMEMPYQFGNGVETTSPGIVKDRLGPDGKPVYGSVGPVTNPETGNPVSNTRDTFDDWYNDRPGINRPITVILTLDARSDDADTYFYQNNAFFPIDDRGWGNEALPHNFHFTTEIHAKFRYRGGEKFKFVGDDDLFVFVNRQLALDLGGFHAKVEGLIDFDAQKEALNIEVGQKYELVIFHAERHTSESNFRIETSIDCFRID